MIDREISKLSFEDDEDEEIPVKKYKLASIYDVSNEDKGLNQQPSPIISTLKEQQPTTTKIRENSILISHDQDMSLSRFHSGEHITVEPHNPYNININDLEEQKRDLPRRPPTDLLADRRKPFLKPLKKDAQREVEVSHPR
jgi:hypothetical protein